MNYQSRAEIGLTGCIVTATSNPAKLREIKEAMQERRSLILIAQSELNISPVPENGQSFVENAISKARHASAQSGLPALADDSGLVVHALGGQPGVHSSRYAGEGATDEQNVQLLLQTMAAVVDSERRATFVCVLVFMRRPDDPSPVIAEGFWNGRVLRAAHAIGGFGYDPVFEVCERNCSAAELTLQEKNRISHRGKAIRNLLQRLESM